MPVSNDNSSEMAIFQQNGRKFVFFVNHSTLIKRFVSTIKKDNVRVRFAPSPTGLVHVGGLRTALYNHLFAKSKNGTTILRIEDTDQARKVDHAAERIIEDLKWCGINYDEGPYYQSERKELYEKHAKILVESGEAYYCFCSVDRLNLLRKNLIKSGEVVRYDNKCRQLSQEEVYTKLKNNESYSIRFKLNDTVVEFEDLIFGRYHCNLTETEGDPIILKSDGFPTYHLANVVDDHDMKISHVLRGLEWLISTIKHLQLFKAFNWEPPQYGHLPLLLNADGKKFSKRQNDIHISYFRENGIFPNALINIVTRAGGGFDIVHSDRDDKNFTMEELIQRFDLSKVHKNSCKLPIQRLLDSNRLEIKRMMNDEKDSKVLIKQIQDCVINHFRKRDPNIIVCIDDDYVLKVLDIAKDRIFKVEDLLSNEFNFMWVKPRYKFQDSQTLKKENLEHLITQLSTNDWTRDSLCDFMKEFAKSQNIKFAELMHNVRFMLTNLKDGPPVVDILVLLGKDSSIERIKSSLT